MDRSTAYLTQNLVFPLFNEKSLDVIDQFFAEEADIKTTFISGKGPDILKKSVKDTFDIFPNLNVDISEVVEAGNKHIYKWQAQGVHAGSLMGMPPTNRDIQFSGVVYGEMEAGYITTYHSFSNIPQVLQNLYSLSGIANSQAGLNVHSAAQAANAANLFIDIHSENKKSNSAVSDICLALKKLTRFPLTRREIECLGTWIKGCSIKESARRMGGLSERTIQTYRESIKKKFGVYNYQQVLYVIKNNGLLPLLL